MQRNQPAFIMDRWQKPGDEATIQKFTTRYDLSEQYYRMTQSDARITDASLIRLKNVSLSYQIPVGWKSALKLQNCRVFFQGQNLLTFTSYKGLDPENRTFNTIPPLKMFTIGLQAGL
jgi:TonB-dependent starch-binding outer membrane protein SusC